MIPVYHRINTLILYQFKAEDRINLVDQLSFTEIRIELSTDERFFSVNEPLTSRLGMFCFRGGDGYLWLLVLPGALMDMKYL